MTGPHRLQDPREMVAVNSVGVYWLAHRRGGPIRYVGSTPDGGTLRSRLSDHAYYGIYTWFWFEVTPHAQAALWRECQEYARHLRTLDNRIRPKFCRMMTHYH